MSLFLSCSTFAYVYNFYHSLTATTLSATPIVSQSACAAALPIYPPPTRNPAWSILFKCRPVQWYVHILRRTARHMAWESNWKRNAHNNGDEPHTVQRHTPVWSNVPVTGDVVIMCIVQWTKKWFDLQYWKMSNDLEIFVQNLVVFQMQYFHKIRRNVLNTYPKLNDSMNIHS